MIERSYEIHGRPLFVRSEIESSIEVLDSVLSLYRAGPRLVTGEAATGLHIEVMIDEIGAGVPAVGRDVGHTEDGTRFVIDTNGTLLVIAPGVGHAEINPERSRAQVTMRADDTGRMWRSAHRLVYPAMMELLKGTGLFSIHASAVAHEKGGLLLCGPSGSAKSTLSLALARAGLGLLSDDTCFVQRDASGAISILAFWEDLHLTEQTLELLDAADVRSVAERRPQSEKWFVPLRKLTGLRPVPRAEPRWLVFPGFDTKGPTRLSPLTKSEAMGRLVRQSLVPTADVHARAQFDLLTALCETAACLQLHMAGDPAESVRCLLERLDGSPARP